jgi:hypothetical protein
MSIILIQAKKSMIPLKKSLIIKSFNIFRNFFLLCQVSSTSRKKIRFNWARQGGNWIFIFNKITLPILGSEHAYFEKIDKKIMNPKKE